MEISFTRLGELAACEATYQVTALNVRKYGLLLRRDEFLRGKFTVAITCDGLIAIAQAGIDMQLILQKVPLSNGRAGGHKSQRIIQ